MLFPVIKLYVFAFICRNLVDAGLVRVKRSANSYEGFDLNSLDLSSPEWVRKHLKNKVIQKDAITFELGMPHYEILNPEDLPEIITHEHPHYHENLKLYGHDDDYTQSNDSLHYDYLHNSAHQNEDQKIENNNQDRNEQQQAETNSNERVHPVTSGEIDKSDESMSDEIDDSEEAPFKFIFVKAKRNPTTTEDIATKSAKQDSEDKNKAEKEEQQTTEASKPLRVDGYQYQYHTQRSPEISQPRKYEEQKEEPQAAASLLSRPQYASAPYNSYQPNYMSAQSSSYVNPFNYYNYHYGSGQPPYYREFERLYRSAVPTQNQYNPRLFMNGYYSAKNYY